MQVLYRWPVRNLVFGSFIYLLLFSFFSFSVFAVTWTRPYGGNLTIYNYTVYGDNITNIYGDVSGINQSVADSLYYNVVGDTLEGNMDVAEYNISNVHSLIFNTSICSDTDNMPSGSLCWNPDEDTVNIVRNNGQIIQVGKELGEDGINRDGSTVNDGSVVYLSGVSGDNPEFKRADGSNVSESSLVGIVTVECLANELCPVVVFGFVNNLDTSSWSPGDKLYINYSSPGDFTNIKPVLPNNPVWVATVVRSHATTGRIFVSPKVDPSDGFLIQNVWATGNITANGVYSDFYDWVSGDDWTIFDGKTLLFNESKISTVYYNATSYSIVRGTFDGGTLANTQHPDGNYDSITLNFSEVAIAPALDVRFNFSGISGFNRGIIRYKTTNHLGEDPIIQLWDYEEGEWEDYPNLVETNGLFALVEQSVFDDSNHVNNSIVRMRIYKAGNGNVNNDYAIDWITISQGVGTPSGMEVDPYAIHKDGSTSVEANIPFGNYNISGDWVKFNYSVFKTSYANTVDTRYLTSTAELIDVPDEILFRLGTGGFIIGSEVYTDSLNGGTTFGAITSPGATVDVQGDLNVLNAATFSSSIEAASLTLTDGGPLEAGDGVLQSLLVTGSVDIDGVSTFNGPVYFRNNVTITTPGSSFVNESTEWYNIAGVTKAVVNASGKSYVFGDFSVGTSTNTQRFSVDGNVYIDDGGLIFDNDAGSERLIIGPLNYNLIIKSRGNDNQEGVVFRDSSDVDWATFDSVNQRVGIGTTSPDTDLDVAGNIEFTNSEAGSINTKATTRGSIEISYPNLVSTLGIINRPVSYGNNFFINSSGEYSKRTTAIGGSGIVMGAPNGNTGGFEFIGLTDTNNAVVTTVTRMVIDNDGDVGIGTTSPSSPLDVVSSGNSTNVQEWQSSDATSLGEVFEASDTRAVLKLRDASGNEDIRFDTGSNSWFNGGNLGLGTNTPGGDLHIKKANQDSTLVLEQSGNGYTSGVQFIRERASGTGITGGCIGMDSDTSTNNPNLVLDVDSSVSCGQSYGAQQRLELKASGTMFIGNMDLVINQSNGQFGFGVDGNGLYTLTPSITLAGNTGLRMASDGNVGINTISPSYELTVAGDGEIQDDFYIGQTYADTYEYSCHIDWDGDDFYAECDNRGTAFDCDDICNAHIVTTPECNAAAYVSSLVQADNGPLACSTSDAFAKECHCVDLGT